MPSLDARLKVMEQARDKRLDALSERFHRRLEVLFTSEEYRVLALCWNEHREPKTAEEQSLVARYVGDSESQRIVRLMDLLITGRGHALSNSGQRWDGVFW